MVSIWGWGGWKWKSSKKGKYNQDTLYEETAIYKKKKIKKNGGLPNLKLCFKQNYLEYGGSLNENAPHRLTCLNICFIIAGTV